MAAVEVAKVHIPVIDLSGNANAVAEDMVSAIRDYGFVFIHGGALGISQGSVEGTFDIVNRDSYSIQPSIR